MGVHLRSMLVSVTSTNFRSVSWGISGGAMHVKEAKIGGCRKGSKASQSRTANNYR